MILTLQLSWLRSNKQCERHTWN